MRLLKVVTVEIGGCGSRGTSWKLQSGDEVSLYQPAELTT
jgi:hypothetical protein